MILFYLYAAFLVMAVVLVVRIAYIQLFWKLDKNLERNFRPTSVKTVIDPKRGAIIGSDGKLLAMSTPLYELFMDCTVRKDYFAGKGKEGKELEAEWQEKAKLFAKGLADEMGADGDAYWKMIQKGRKDGARYMRLGHPIDRAALLRIQKLPLMNEGQYKSGVIVTKKDTRQYPYGKLAVRTIGYVKDNSNSNGNNHIGLEGKYDYVLHGKEGEMWTRPTENKERIQNYDSLYVKPEDGLDVRTTLDITMQDIVDKALRRQIEEDKSIEMGCAIIMDVKTGAIRSMVNLVRDSTDWSLNETYNMAIGLNSEPGSVFKATTLMTALEDGVILSLDDRIPTNNGVLPDRHLNPSRVRDLLQLRVPLPRGQELRRQSEKVPRQTLSLQVGTGFRFRSGRTAAAGDPQSRISEVESDRPWLRGYGIRRKRDSATHPDFL